MVLKSTVGEIWNSREKIEQNVSASDIPPVAKKRCLTLSPLDLFGIFTYFHIKFNI